MGNVLEELSSAQYAFRTNIAIQRYFYFDDDDYDLVYHNFKDKGRQVVAYKFKDVIHCLDAFPLSFNGSPKQSQIEYFLERISTNLGFLNKDVNTNHLLTYIEIVIKNKYYIYDYNINPTKFKDYIIKGKQMELEEMDLSTRKYMFLDEYRNLDKSTKIKIMNKDRFKKIVTETTEIVFDAVIDLLDNYDDFIHNGLIAERTGLSPLTVHRYTEVYKEKIDNHNKAKYGTDNYNEYQLKCNIDEIKYAISSLKLNKKKPNIKNIANKAKLHRNTVSRLIKKHNLI